MLLAALVLLVLFVLFAKNVRTGLVDRQQQALLLGDAAARTGLDFEPPSRGVEVGRVHGYIDGVRVEIDGYTDSALGGAVTRVRAWLEVDASITLSVREASHSLQTGESTFEDWMSATGAEGAVCAALSSDARDALRRAKDRLPSLVSGVLTLTAVEASGETITQMVDEVGHICAGLRKYDSWSALVLGDPDVRLRARTLARMSTGPRVASRLLDGLDPVAALEGGLDQQVAGAAMLAAHGSGLAIPRLNTLADTLEPELADFVHRCIAQIRERMGDGRVGGVTVADEGGGLMLADGQRPAAEEPEPF